MRRSLRKMLSPGEQEEPQGAVYQGVENDMDDSKDSLKVPRAMGGGDGSGARAGAAVLNSALRRSGFASRQPRDGRTPGTGDLLRIGGVAVGARGRVNEAPQQRLLCPFCLPAGLLNLPLPLRGHLQSGETYPKVLGLAGLASSSREWGRQEGLWKRRPSDVG